MRRCHEIRVDLPAYLSAELDSDRAAVLDDHLAVCGACLAELSELDLVTTALSNSGLEHRPPAHLEHEVLTLVTLEPDPAGREGAVKDASLASRLQGRSIKVVVAPMLATTAVILAALGMAWRSDLNDARDQIRAIQQQLGPTGATVQSISFQEAGSGEASARGELVRQPDGNHRIVLWAKDLPATPAAYHYEVWLSGDEGWVSAGSFRVAEGDSLLWSCPVGVSPAAYPQVWVTLEPDDGDPRRTGRSVLRATL
jgi:hypothetical protein